MCKPSGRLLLETASREWGVNFLLPGSVDRLSRAVDLLTPDEYVRRVRVRSSALDCGPTTAAWWSSASTASPPGSWR
jgi:hypothetical protein